MALVPSKCTLTPRYDSQNPSAPHLWVMVSLKPSSLGPCTPQSHTCGAQCPPTPTSVSLFPLNLTSMDLNIPQTQSMGPSAPLTPICDVQTLI